MNVFIRDINYLRIRLFKNIGIKSIARSLWYSILFKFTKTHQDEPNSCVIKPDRRGFTENNSKCQNQVLI